jgi:two-component sensor histidine kinase
VPQKSEKQSVKRDRRKTLEKDVVRLPRRGWFLAWFIGAALVAAGAGFRIALDIAIDAPVPRFITFYPLLGLVGFLCGAKVGVAATVGSSALVWYYWLGPTPGWSAPDRFSIIAFGIFFVLGSFTAWIGAWVRGLFEKIQAARSEQSRLARETVHRLKNLIAVVQGLSHQTSRSATTIQEYRAELDRRLLALAHTQDLVLNGGAASLRIASFIEAATSAFRDNPNFEVAGRGDFIVPEAAHLGLTLAIGELGTNSFKYGALAGKGGKARISWMEQNGRRSIVWQEDAVISPDNRQGFGSRLIAASLDRVEEAKVDYAATDGGIEARFDWPVET